jgi:hypothetical protein
MSVESTANTAFLTRTTGFANATPTTIACWLRLNSLVGNVIWDHGNNTVFTPELYLDPGGPRISLTYGFQVVPQDQIVLVSPSTNTWYFCACIFNGTGNPVVIHIAAAGAASLTKITTPLNFAGWSGTVLTLYNDLVDDETMDGQLTSMKIWSGTGGALTDDEVANEWHRFQPSKTSPLYGFYPLLSSPNAGVDVSGNGHDLTVSGSPATQRTAPPIPWRGGLA